MEVERREWTGAGRPEDHDLQRELAGRRRAGRVARRRGQYRRGRERTPATPIPACAHTLPAA
jgi:hypothetical protein